MYIIKHFMDIDFDQSFFLFGTPLYCLAFVLHYFLGPKMYLIMIIFHIHSYQLEWTIWLGWKYFWYTIMMVIVMNENLAGHESNLCIYSNWNLYFCQYTTNLCILLAKFQSNKSRFAKENTSIHFQCGIGYNQYSFKIKNVSNILLQASWCHCHIT